MSKETEKTSTHCRICGRRLTVRVSVEREIGPVCWGRLKRGEVDAKFEADQEAMEDRLRGEDEAIAEAEAREQEERAREEEQEREHWATGPEGEPET